MVLGLLIGVWLLLGPTGVWAESESMATTTVTSPAQEVTSAQVQQQHEKLRAELKKAKDRIAALEKQLNQESGDQSLSWGVSQAGF